MTLKEYIKKNKLNKSENETYIYISLYNKDNKRFYGSFINSGNLDEYLNMEIVDGRRFSNTSSIYCIQLKDYSYPLGLDSIRMFEEREINRKSKRGNTSS